MKFERHKEIPPSASLSYAKLEVNGVYSRVLPSNTATGFAEQKRGGLRGPYTVLEKICAVRKITIKVSIKPDKTRQTATTKVDVTSKLAPVKSSDGMMFIGFDENNALAAYEDNFNQPELDADDAPSIYKMAGQTARS